MNWSVVPMLGLALLLNAAGMAAQPESAAPRPSQRARYGPWRSCMIGGGGYLQNVVLCPSDRRRVYSYVDVGGVYRSDDAGRRWRMMNAGLPSLPSGQNVRSLTVDPRDADRVIIAVGDAWTEARGIFVSSDGGETWRNTLAAPFFGNGEYRWAGPLLARHPAKPDIVLAASVDRGLWRSADNGETWQQCGATGLHPTDLRFDVANPDRVWLCAQDSRLWVLGEERAFKAGFFRSDDGGRTWVKVANRSPSEILQDPGDAHKLYGIIAGAVHISRDQGVTWEPFAEGLPARTSEGYASEDEFESLAAGPGFLLTASTKGTFYRLHTGEGIWRKIEREGLREIYEGEEWFRHESGGFGSALCSIIIDPRDPDHWFFTDWFAIYQTSDGGRNWELTIDGIEDTVIHVLQQDPSDCAVVHLGMADNGYFRSTDGGVRFHSIPWRDGITNNIKCLALSPAQPNRVYAVGPRQWQWEANQVFISENGGRTWKRSPMQGLPDMTEHHCNTIAVDPRDSDSVYLAVSGKVKPQGGGVYHSVDGGESWAWMGEGLPEGAEFFSHSIWDTDREIAVGPDGSMVCIRHDRWEVWRWDGGANAWVQADVNMRGAPNGVVADVLRPGRFFLAAGGIHRSDDGGKTWAEVLAADARHVTADFATPNRVAAGTQDGVALSEDGGATWRVLDRRLPNRLCNTVAFAGDRLIVGSSGSGAFWLPLTAAAESPITAKGTD
jgi:photosystem II stability/assembly factor-like uncharacterized protein